MRESKVEATLTTTRLGVRRGQAARRTRSDMANGATGEEFRVIKNMLLGAVRGTNENKVERRQERSFAEARLSQPLRLVSFYDSPREAEFSFWLLEFVQFAL